MDPFYSRSQHCGELETPLSDTAVNTRMCPVKNRTMAITVMVEEEKNRKMVFPDNVLDHVHP